MESLDTESLPPGFGFHPTDEEIISHYLKRKVRGQRVDSRLIPVVEIYKHEPWDLPAKCPIPTRDSKWHFFTLRDRKYPNGFRSNRATAAGYWKSTGKDRNIKSHNHTVGTKKTLVFHEGRPPAGQRTEWIMHEYYLDESECGAAPESKDIFVLCRVTKRDGWTSHREIKQAYEGPEVPVQIVEGNNNNNVEKQTDTANSFQQEPAISSDDIDDLDAWIESLLPPDSVLEGLTEADHETETFQQQLCSLIPKEEMVDSGYDKVEADDLNFLLKEDIDSILLNSDSFAPYTYDQIDMGELNARSFSQPTSHMSINAIFVDKGSFASDNENESNELPILSDDESTVLVQRRTRTGGPSAPAPGTQFQNGWAGSCKLKVTRNCRSMKGTMKFSNEDNHVNVDSHKKDINLESSSHYNSSVSDEESDFSSQGNKSLDVSETSQESGLTNSDTPRKSSDDVLVDACTHKSPNASRRLFKSTGPSYLIMSMFVVVVAAFVYILLQRTPGATFTSSQGRDL